MAVTYSPTSHVAPITATASVGGQLVNVEGLSPGRTYNTLADQWAPATVFLPTGVTSDGFPGVMVPVATGSGTVT
jgi:hypothetical protein